LAKPADRSRRHYQACMISEMNKKRILKKIADLERAWKEKTERGMYYTIALHGTPEYFG
jgi:hypothetical protein